MDRKPSFKSRREFLGDIGKGMLVAGLGSSLAGDLGIAQVWGGEAETPLNFGNLEPLVALMQETAPAKLTAILVDELKGGTPLKTLVAAGALANARTFGGQDYIGFHTFMALAPAFRMARQLPTELQPLPVLKVLYRNANRMQDLGGRKNEVLHTVAADTSAADGNVGERVREFSRKGDIAGAERAFAALSQAPIGEAFNHLQFAVDDEVDVHRIVLAWRAWDTMELAGEEWGHCMLRQSVRYCANVEKSMIERDYKRCLIREVLPKLLDQYQLLGRDVGKRDGDDDWLRQLAQTIFRGTREQAADAVAQAIQEGFSPDAIGEAISVAANWLVLHDPGRPEQWANVDKPIGSCHGDSVGVHASDAANAWRNIVRVSNPRNVVASLIVGAFHTGGQSDRSNKQPYPFAEHLAKVKSETAAQLLNEADEAIRSKEQFLAAAIVDRYGQLGYEPGPVFDLLLKYATSEDGALHAEKYFHTASVEFSATRKAFRWGQLVALARVSASEYGHSSPGYQEASRLLDIKVG